MAENMTAKGGLGNARRRGRSSSISLTDDLLCLQVDFLEYERNGLFATHQLPSQRTQHRYHMPNFTPSSSLTTQDRITSQIAHPSKHRDCPNWALVAGGVLAAAISLFVGWKRRRIFTKKRKPPHMLNAATKSTSIQSESCNPETASIDSFSNGLSNVNIRPRSSDALISTKQSSTCNHLPTELGDAGIIGNGDLAYELRQRLKSSEEMIFRTQTQISEQEHMIFTQLSPSAMFELQWNASNRSLFAAETEIQRLHKAMDDHCASHHCVPLTSENSTVKIMNDFLMQGFTDNVFPETKQKIQELEYNNQHVKMELVVSEAAGPASELKNIKEEDSLADFSLKEHEKAQQQFQSLKNKLEDARKLSLEKDHQLELCESERTQLLKENAELRKKLTFQDENQVPRIKSKCNRLKQTSNCGSIRYHSRGYDAKCGNIKPAASAVLPNLRYVLDDVVASSSKCRRIPLCMSNKNSETRSRKPSSHGISSSVQVNSKSHFRKVDQKMRLRNLGEMKPRMDDEYVQDFVSYSAQVSRECQHKIPSVEEGIGSLKLEQVMPMLSVEAATLCTPAKDKGFSTFFNASESPAVRIGSPTILTDTQIPKSDGVLLEMNLQNYDAKDRSVWLHDPKLTIVKDTLEILSPLSLSSPLLETVTNLDFDC